MKHIFLIFFMAVFANCMYSQGKPDKTFDHNVFAKRVYGNFSAGMDQSVFLPDNKALEYISSKTGRSLESLNAEKELNKQYLSDDRLALQKENAGGKTVSAVELIKIDHPQLTIANIIIVAGNIRIELGNCIQTDKTWVLGDYFGLEGKKPERVKPVSKDELTEKYLAMNEIDYNSLKYGTYAVNTVILVNSEYPKGKISRGKHLAPDNFYHMDFKIDANGKATGQFSRGEAYLKSWNSTYKIDKENSQLMFYDNNGQLSDQFNIKSISGEYMLLVADYDNGTYYFVANYYEEKPAIEDKPKDVVKENKTRYSITVPAKGATGESTLINPSLYGKPMRGFYIDKDGNRHEAVIKYQGPENMNTGTSALLIYKTAYNETGFTEDESKNFITAKAKAEVQAFYLNGHMYVPIRGNQWGILIREGAIRESVFLERSKSKSGQEFTVESYFVHKRDGNSLGIAALALSFKSQMSKFLADYLELSAKVANAETGYKYLQYQKVVEEYNKWIDENKADQAPVYIFSDLSLSVKKEAKTENLEVAIEAPDVPNTELPAKFSKLPGKWMFSKVLQNGKDVSSDFRWTIFNGQPIVLVYEKDGKIIYPAGSVDAIKIKEGMWQYRPNQERDLKITTIMVGGSAEETFKIISVTDQEFIYEDTRAKARYIFIRSK